MASDLRSWTEVTDVPFVKISKPADKSKKDDNQDEIKDILYKLDISIAPLNEQLSGGKNVESRKITESRFAGIDLDRFFEMPEYNFLAACAGQDCVGCDDIFCVSMTKEKSNELYFLY